MCYSFAVFDNLLRYPLIINSLFILISEFIHAKQFVGQQTKFSIIYVLQLYNNLQIRKKKFEYSINKYEYLLGSPLVTMYACKRVSKNF